MSLTQLQIRTSRPAKAALLMLSAMLAFSMMSVFVRLSAAQLHSFEVAFFRNFLAVLMFVPLIVRMGPQMLRSAQPKLHLIRAGLGAMAMMSFFTALTLIPLAETTALGFASPFFATLGAILFLGERIRLHRSIALIVGFIGVMVVLRPGYVEISLGAALMLLSALLIGITAVLVKKLSATDAPEAIAIWMVVLQTPVTFIAALFVWQWPTAETFGWLLCLAFAGTIGHLCWTRAMAIAEVSSLARTLTSPIEKLAWPEKTPAKPPAKAHGPRPFSRLSNLIGDTLEPTIHKLIIRSDVGHGLRRILVDDLRRHRLFAKSNADDSIQTAFAMPPN